MKAFLIGIVVLVIALVGAYFGLKYFYKSPANTGTSSYQTTAISRTGELRKSNVTGSDFTHVLITPDKSIGIASYTLHLDDYIGKKVEVTGQFSGTTLYADTIKVVQ